MMERKCCNCGMIHLGQLGTADFCSDKCSEEFDAYIEAEMHSNPEQNEEVDGSKTEVFTDSVVDIDRIQADAPEDAAYWSPSVGQYFNSQFMNLSPAFKDSLVQVDKPFRDELVPLPIYIDRIIYKLFSSRWVGESVTCSLEAMKMQLHKNLSNQIEGYWSGHTAYHIMVDGGFLVDAPHTNGKPKKLTKLGELFMAQYELI